MKMSILSIVEALKSYRVEAIYALTFQRFNALTIQLFNGRVSGVRYCSRKMIRALVRS
jgi:hypothetical protein